MRWKTITPNSELPAFASVADRELPQWWNVPKNLTNRSAVILSLQNPREKIWGILLSINTFGITARGIDINSFPDWVRSVANNTESMSLSTMFVPMMRVEKVTLDETFGMTKSFSEQFFERVGRSVLEVMELPDDDDVHFSY
jgi:hypothetical protein